LEPDVSQHPACRRIGKRQDREWKDIEEDSQESLEETISVK
jgi:hypothetical protein